ncbi:unnamed protein product [Cylicocyclus nassatus]|uniref:Uncharacterized protein n=1 Tax=Cylicocyclus nassatus TaxID=53992 RepID=A0AA36GW59_CYLNA|nr:unnamed protein product [Cylicocyclus nassatus]
MLRSNETVHSYILKRRQESWSFSNVVWSPVYGRLECRFDYSFRSKSSFLLCSDSSAITCHFTLSHLFLVQHGRPITAPKLVYEYRLAGSFIVFRCDR